MKTTKRFCQALGVILVMSGCLYSLYFHPRPEMLADFSHALSSNHVEETMNTTPPPVNTTPPVDTTLTSRRNVTKPVMVVIVSSNPRSGSSFLGELLSSPANAIYFFEPFRYALEIRQAVTKTMHMSPDKTKRDYVQNELLKLMTCRLTEPMFNASLDFKILANPKLLVPLTEKQRTSICHDLDLRVVKVVRPGLGGVLPLLQLPDHNIHIIHIVRDPRAIINSVRENENWAKTLTADKVCKNFALDMDSAQNVTNPRYTMIKYEDLIANTTEQARRLFARIGLKMTGGVEQFINMHTNSTKYKKPRFRPLEHAKHLFNLVKSVKLFANRPRSSLSDARRRTTTSELRDKVTSYRHRRAATAELPDKATSYRHRRTTAELRGKATRYRHRRAATAELPDKATRYRHQRAARTQSWTSSVDFKSYYGTFRDVKFDGLHWLKELPKDIRREVEQECADVLKRLDYPLLYPGE